MGKGFELRLLQASRCKVRWLEFVLMCSTGKCGELPIHLVIAGSRFRGARASWAAPSPSLCTLRSIQQFICSIFSYVWWQRIRTLQLRATLVVHNIDCFLSGFFKPFELDPRAVFVFPRHQPFTVDESCLPAGSPMSTITGPLACSVSSCSRLRHVCGGLLTRPIWL